MEYYEDFGELWQNKHDIQKLIETSFENFWSIFESPLDGLELNSSTLNIKGLEIIFGLFKE